MNRSEYEHYLVAFNTRDYQAVLAHFAEDFELMFAGYRFTTRQQVLDFYGFLHQYVTETVTVQRFVADRHTTAIEADVCLHAFKDLTTDRLARQGLDRLVALKQGDTVIIPQFIHYHFRDGKIVKAMCTIFDPPHV